MVKQAVSMDWAEEVFDVEVVYVPGVENYSVRCLSCLYLNDEPGSMHEKQIHVQHCYE